MQVSILSSPNSISVVHLPSVLQAICRRLTCWHANQDQSRTIYIQVKTKRSGRSWQSSIVNGKRTKPPAEPLNETVFLVFVDLGDSDSSPRYWIVPDWWIRNDIYKAHKAYLKRPGGHAPAIQTQRIIP